MSEKFSEVRSDASLAQEMETNNESVIDGHLINTFNNDHAGGSHDEGMDIDEIKEVPKTNTNNLGQDPDSNVQATSAYSELENNVEIEKMVCETSDTQCNIDVNVCSSVCGSQLEKEASSTCPVANTKSEAIDETNQSGHQDIKDESKSIIEKYLLELQHMKENSQSVSDRTAVMTKLRKVFSDPIDDSFHLRLTQADFESLLTIGVKLETEKRVSEIILEYKDQPITKEIADYLIEAYWILTNISSGDTRHTRAVISAGSVPFAMEIIHTSPFSNILSQCLMFMGNVLVDDDKILDEILHGTMFTTIKDMFVRVDNDCKSQIIHLYFSIVKTRQCGLPIPLVEGMLHQAISVTHANAPVSILRPVMDLVNEATKVARNSYQLINMFTEFGLVTKLVSCMGHENTTVRNRCLMSVGNLLLGTDEQTWNILKTGIIAQLAALLHNAECDTIKHTLWILSNVAAGEDSMMNTILESDFLPAILHHLTSGLGQVAIEALWTTNNLIKDSSKSQKEKYLLYNTCLLSSLMKVLQSDQDKMQPKTTSDNQFINLACESIQELLQMINRDVSDSDKAQLKELYVAQEVNDILTGLSEKTYSSYDISDNISAAMDAYEDAFGELTSDIEDRHDDDEDD